MKNCKSHPFHMAPRLVVIILPSSRSSFLCMSWTFQELLPFPSSPLPSLVRFAHNTGFVSIFTFEYELISWIIYWTVGLWLQLFSAQTTTIVIVNALVVRRYGTLTRLISNYSMLAKYWSRLMASKRLPWNTFKSDFNVGIKSQVNNPRNRLHWSNCYLVFNKLH
jgi:hypothetical protein